MENPGRRVLNVADPDPPTVAGIAAAVATALGRPIPLVPFSGPPPLHVGASPWSVPALFTVDCSAARALGWTCPPYAETVADLVRWLVSATANADWRTLFPVFGQYGHDPFDYAAEDAFLAKRAPDRG